MQSNTDLVDGMCEGYGPMLGQYQWSLFALEHLARWCLVKPYDEVHQNSQVVSKCRSSRHDKCLAVMPPLLQGKLVSGVNQVAGGPSCWSVSP